MSHLRKVGGVVAMGLFSVYFIGVMLTTPYYNWRFARENGLLAWVFLGEIVPTLKALAWPYFVFAVRETATGRETTTTANIREYVDNEYGFAFQFPMNWKMQNAPTGNEIGEVRVLIQGPKGRGVMATVGNVGRSLTREQFEGSAVRDKMVDKMIDLTVEQVYKRASQQIKATRMIVSEKRQLRSNVGFGFYISTAQFTEKVPMLVAGQHIVPFGKNYMVSFLMFAPIDKTATADNTEMDRVFQSFHLLGETPRQ